LKISTGILKQVGTALGGASEEEMDGVASIVKNAMKIPDAVLGALGSSED